MVKGDNVYVVSDRYGTIECFSSAKKAIARAESIAGAEGGTCEIPPGVRGLEGKLRSRGYLSFDDAAMETVASVNHCTVQ